MSGKEYNEKEKLALRQLAERELNEVKNVSSSWRTGRFCGVVIAISFLLIIGFAVGSTGFVRGHLEYFFPSS